MANTVPAAEQLASYTNFVNPQNPVDNLNWIRQAFMLNTINSTDISDADLAARIATTAAWKFTDTSLGGSFAINVPPGFTEFADITMGGDQSQVGGSDPTRPTSSLRTLRTTQGGFGIGRYYSEAIDDNAQTVTMAFGIKDFNSLTSFFANFYDPRASQLVRTGRSQGAFFQMGQITGALLSIPFIPLVAGSTIVKALLNIPATKFSYFKPTMPLYWNAVNTILNGITANLGIHSRQLTAQQKLMYKDPLAQALSQETAGQVTSDDAGLSSTLRAEIAALHQFIPNIYTAQGGIDIYAVATRAQALADAHTQKLQQILDSATDVNNLRQRLQNELISGNLSPSPQPYSNLSDRLQAYLTSTGGQASDQSGGADEESMGYDSNPSGGGAAAAALGETTNSATNANSGLTSINTENSSQQGRFGQWFSQFWEGLKSDLHDGSGYVTFRTDYGGSIGESFSNSMRSSDLEQKINSMSSESRMASYDLAGGHLVGGAVGELLNGVMGAVKDTVSGLLAGVQLSGVAALAGAAYVDIPKMYDSSSAQLPTQSFTIELRSWSGHRLALVQNLYAPLAMLLAGVLPRSTGPQSFNGPFSCQLFARGRMQVRDGLITDMSITRGTGNVGWTPEGLPLGIDVTFTVTDFSSVMHMPIIAQSGFYDKVAMAAGQAIGAGVGAALGNQQQGEQTGQTVGAALTAGMYTDDSLFTDYLAILAGLGWKDQVYPFRRWSIYRDRSALNYDTFKSPYHAAGWFAGSLPGRIIQGIVHGTDRP